MGRPPVGKVSMTDAERTRRYRVRLRDDFVRELVTFYQDYSDRFRVWRSSAGFSEEDRDHLMRTIHQVADDLSGLAQDLFDDTPSERRPETAKAKATSPLTERNSVTLDEARRAIQAKFGIAMDADIKAHRARLDAGRMLLDLRQRIEAGEAGEHVTWWSWYKGQFVRSRQDAERVMKMAAYDAQSRA